MKKFYKRKIYVFSKFLKKNELKLLIIKSISSDLRFINYIRFFFFKFLFNSFKVRIRFFCIQTSQIRGLVHFFNTFRMHFRENALFAKYAGIKKRSW